jgi:hypothetical protein
MSISIPTSYALFVTFAYDLVVLYWREDMLDIAQLLSVLMIAVVSLGTVRILQLIQLS